LIRGSGAEDVDHCNMQGAGQSVFACVYRKTSTDAWALRLSGSVERRLQRANEYSLMCMNNNRRLNCKPLRLLSLIHALIDSWRILPHKKNIPVTLDVCLHLVVYRKTSTDARALRLLGSVGRRLQLANEYLVFRAIVTCLDGYTSIGPPDFRAPLGPIMKRHEIFVTCRSVTKSRTVTGFRSQLTVL
jgi:hypothetical protein